MNSFEKAKEAQNYIREKKDKYCLEEKTKIEKRMQNIENGKESKTLDEDIIFKYSAIFGSLTTFLSLLFLGFSMNLNFFNLVAILVGIFILSSTALFFLLKTNVIKIKDRDLIKELNDLIERPKLSYEIEFSQNYSEDSLIKKIANLIGEDAIINLFLMKEKKILSEQEIKNYIDIMKKTGKDPLSNNDWEFGVTNKDIENLVQKHYEFEMKKK